MVFSANKLKLAALFCLCGVFFSLRLASANLDKNASRALSHYIMASMYDNLGETTKAIWEYKQALNSDNKNAAIRLNLAVSYIKNNQANNARQELETAARLDPEAVDSHAILSLLYSLQNNPDKASREYEIALKNASKINPQDIEIYRNLGALYISRKNFPAAESTYRLILDLAGGNDSQAHFYLANIYNQAGDNQKAQEELKKALEINPDYADALNYLGYLYIETGGNLDSAEAMIKKALEIQPDTAGYLDSLGWLYFKKGDIDQALKLLIKASALLEDPVIYSHLGDVYWQKGEPENARANWQKSLELGPDQEAIAKKLEELDRK